MKMLSDVIDSASPEQIRSWFESIQKDEWPADMPIPGDVFQAVWYPMLKAYTDLPLAPAVPSKEAL